MEQANLTAPQNVLTALKNGEKIAVFSLDEEGNPKKYLSDVNLRVSLNYDKTSDLLEPAVKYLRANFNKDVKLKFLSDLCDISPSYFSRLFVKQTGKNLGAYVADLRLEQACRLLTATNRSVVSIACEAGYVDCGYFYKLFRKKYGCTPLEYRRSQMPL